MLHQETGQSREAEPNCESAMKSKQWPKRGWKALKIYFGFTLQVISSPVQIKILIKSTEAPSSPDQTSDLSALMWFKSPLGTSGVILKRWADFCFCRWSSAGSVRASRAPTESFDPGPGVSTAGPESPKALWPGGRRGQLEMSLPSRQLFPVCSSSDSLSGVSTSCSQSQWLSDIISPKDTLWFFKCFSPSQSEPNDMFNECMNFDAANHFLPGSISGFGMMWIVSLETSSPASSSQQMLQTAC